MTHEQQFYAPSNASARGVMQPLLALTAVFIVFHAIALTAQRSAAQRGISRPARQCGLAVYNMLQHMILYNVTLRLNIWC